jgi:hypothetical protein
MEKQSIQIISITCNHTSEAGHDEVYLICQADAGIPIRYPIQLADSHPMTGGNVWNLDDPTLILNFEYEVLVTLWDCDENYIPALSTYLQSIDFERGSGEGYVHLSNPNDANYTIHYKFLS